MATLSAGGAKLLAYWGTIQASVAERMSTAELWQTVQASAAAEGYDISGAGALDMNILRGLAAGNRNAAEQLQRASPNDALQGSMIGSDLAGVMRSYQLATPQWLVRFEHTTVEGEEQVTQWRTSMFGGLLPESKQDLLTQLDADGSLLASEYNTEHVSIGDIAISAL